MLRAVAKAAEMDADALYATAVTIRVESDAVTDHKDNATLTRTSTVLFADVTAIGSFADAKNAAADALDIKSAKLHIVTAKLKVVEEAAPLPTIPAQLTNTEDRIVAQTNAIDLISNAKPKKPSAIIDGWYEPLALKSADH